MKGIVAGIMFALTAQALVGQTPPHVPLGIVSDWTQHHVLYPNSKDDSAMARIQGDPRWVQNWYLRHREVWWPKHHPLPRKRSRRDWSLSLGTSTFEPLFDFTFTIGSDTGYGSLNTTDLFNGEFLATAGTLTVTGTATGQGLGTYPLYPGGPAQTTSPAGKFLYDNVLYPTVDPVINNNGPLFIGSGFEVNIWSDAADSYEFGSGYLYRITNVFKGGAAPTIVWSLPINAVPSAPVYDSVSDKVFFTDSNGRIDYVKDNGSPSSVVYGAVLANGTTSENPVIVDTAHQMVYATFNSNGTNALVVQAPTSMASTVSAAVGTGNTIYTGPNEPDFNNAWYTGSGTPLMYVAGTGTGTLPTLYSIGFNGSGVMNSSAGGTTAVLATGMADSSPVTEFYNAALGKDYIFVGVTDHCVATTGGGAAGCVMSLDVTSGFPTVNASSTALAAAGGTSGIVVDNDSNLIQASSIYYSTKTGANLVKATQSALK